jgi:hypothetical protein
MLVVHAQHRSAPQQQRMTPLELFLPVFHDVLVFLFREKDWLPCHEYAGYRRQRLEARRM